MILDLRVHPTLGNHVYATVLEVDGKVFKLFFRLPEVPPKRGVEGRRRTFQSQCRAYQCASSDPSLRSHVPTFYGPCVIADVIDKGGTSVKHLYLLECCYVLEKLTGDEEKFTLTGLARKHKHLLDAAKRFRRIGISLQDSSVFNPDDPVRFKFIDFDLL